MPLPSRSKPDARAADRRARRCRRPRCSTPRAACTSAAAAVISALNAITFARACARSAADSTLEHGRIGSRDAVEADRDQIVRRHRLERAARVLALRHLARRAAQHGDAGHVRQRGDGHVGAACPRADSAAGGRAGRTAATGGRSRSGSVLVAMLRMSLLPSHTIRKVGFSSQRARHLAHRLVAQGQAQDQELQDVAPVRRAATELSRRRPAAGCRRRRDSMSSPGTARFRTFASASLAEPIPSTLRAISPGSSTPFPFSSSIRYCGGPAGRSMSGCGSFARGPPGDERGRAVHLAGRPGRDEAPGAVAGEDAVADDDEPLQASACRLPRTARRRTGRHQDERDTEPADHARTAGPGQPRTYAGWRGSPLGGVCLQRGRKNYKLLTEVFMSATFCPWAR